MGERRVGVYPGTFDPLTIAHLAVADAAVAQLGLDRLDLVLSLDPIGKGASDRSGLAARAAAIRGAAADRPWLHVETTEARLIADIAAGYDVCVVGADKWEQILDTADYGSTSARDAALARLPLVALAPRGGARVDGHDPGGGLLVLDVPAHLGEVSSSGVRAGREEWRA